MAEPAEVSLPATLRQAVRTEFVLALRPPFESLVTVAVNGALMSSSWFLLPTDLKDKVFTLHGTLAFALVLAAWMYSDVPATNVLGPDARRVTAAIDDPLALGRLLWAKSIFLWLVVTPVCLVVTLFTGIFTHDLLATLYTVIWIGVVPFGVLSITAVNRVPNASRSTASAPPAATAVARAQARTTLPRESSSRFSIPAAVAGSSDLSEFEQTSSPRRPV